MNNIFEIPEIITLSGKKLDCEMDLEGMSRAAGGNDCSNGCGTDNGCNGGGSCNTGGNSGLE